MKQEIISTTTNAEITPTTSFELEIIELDQRFDMTIDPMFAGGFCGGACAGSGGIICGSNCTMKGN